MLKYEYYMDVCVLKKWEVTTYCNHQYLIKFGFNDFAIFGVALKKSELLHVTFNCVSIYYLRFPLIKHTNNAHNLFEYYDRF